MGGHYSMGRRNNQPNDGSWRWVGIREEMGLGGTRGGGHLLIVLGGKFSDYNKENNECDGAISFNGFLWMGECNNQPKVGHYNRI